MNIQSFFSSWNICSLSARGITWHNFMAGLTIETYSGLSLKIWGSYVYVLEFGQLICASGAVFKKPQPQLGDCRSSCGTHSQTCGTPKCRKLLICPLVQQETCPSFCCSSFASVLRRPLYFLQSTMFATGFLNHAKFQKTTRLGKNSGGYNLHLSTSTYGQTMQPEHARWNPAIKRGQPGRYDPTITDTPKSNRMKQTCFEQIKPPCMQQTHLHYHHRDVKMQCWIHGLDSGWPKPTIGSSPGCSVSSSLRDQKLPSD